MISWNNDSFWPWLYHDLCMPDFWSILSYIILCYSKQKRASSCQLVNGSVIVHVLTCRVFQLGPICFFIRVRTWILWNGDCSHPHCHRKIRFKHPCTFYIIPKPFVFGRTVILGIIKWVHSILHPSCWFKPCAVSQVRRANCIIS